MEEQRAPRRPFTRADLRTGHDETAARVVNAGGGIEAVIEASELGTLEQLARRLNASTTTAQYTFPSRVGCSVMSVTQSLLGRSRGSARISVYPTGSSAGVVTIAA